MGRFLRLNASDDRGATAIEYGLIAALIAVAIMVSLSFLGVKTTNMWNNVVAVVLAH
jgi:pilus assembly protein Flp/PilA